MNVKMLFQFSKLVALVTLKFSFSHFSEEVVIDINLLHLVYNLSDQNT